MASEETMQASSLPSSSSFHKRDRELDGDEVVVEESPEAKRLRADLLLDIFDDEDRTVEDEVGADGDLATVMKSLEEEISGLASPAATDELAEVESRSGCSSGSDDITQPELGFLFEASDDELGLPPSLLSGEVGAAEEEASAPSVGEGAALFGQIWGYDDGIPSGGYDAFDFGLEVAGAAVESSTAAAGVSASGEAEQDGSVLFHGGLFEDYSDIWRPESLPAV